MRLCSAPGCPTFLDRPGRCPTHQREYEAKRGTRQQRGYDQAHDRARQAWAPKVATGAVLCSRCGQPIKPGTPWALDHDDNDRRKYRGPSHARCNDAAGGALSAPPPPF